MNRTFNITRIGKLLLEDGSEFPGFVFGLPESTSGEVVFNTGMVGYPETLTDPSYKGQILVFTFPLIGNYGIPADSIIEKLPENFESHKIQIQALIVSENSEEFNHWNSAQSLSSWLEKYNVPGLCGIDTRRLTKLIREHGTMLGKIIVDSEPAKFYDPDIDHLISKVTVQKPEILGKGKKRVLLIDCGCKKSIIENLISRKVEVFKIGRAHV